MIQNGPRPHDQRAIDFFRDESVVVDPYTYFDQLRGKSPIWREPHQGVYLVTGYDEACAIYNDTATSYDTKQQQFPTNMVAGIAKAQPAELWEITEQAERAVPQVDLSMKPPAA